MSRILTGIQSTGTPHLGNILGAILPAIRLAQNPANESFLFIADMHSLTQIKDGATLRNNTYATAATWLAFGLNPEQTVFYRQSDVPEVTELTWYLLCQYPYQRLTLAHSFKDKADRLDDVNGGLFTYPILMAADILLYDADEVPVGEDQRQHIEITRDIAMRFNGRFGDTFVVPKIVTPRAGAKVTDLQEPTAKMSKSSNTDAGIVYLLDEPAAILKKFKRAVTDSDGEVRFDRAEKPGVSNLIEILAACTSRTPQQVAGEYTQYGPLKADAGEAVVEILAPIQHRYHELMGDKAELSRLLRTGAEKARAVASATLERTYNNIGLLSPE